MKTRWLLGLVAAVATAFLALHLWRQSWEMPDIHWGWRSWSALALATLCHLLALSAFGGAWRLLLEGCDAALAWRRALRLFFLSQLGKYIPGNVAQYAGRLELARAEGAPRKEVGLSLTLEIGLSILMAGVLFLMTGLLGNQKVGAVSGWIPHWPMVAAGLLFLLVLVLVLVAIRGSGSGGWSWWPKVKLAPDRLGAVAFAYLLFFACDALGLWFLALGLFDRADLPYAELVGIYAGAWVAGLLSVGAPAGLGVRDLLLVSFLLPFLGAGGATAIALAHRLAVSAGDGLAFPVGLWLGRGEPSRGRIL